MAEQSTAKNEALRAVFERDEPAFIPYLAAGDPSYEASLEYVEALARGGADVIELGLPFSEPIAEGPTIQNAIVRALESGMTPDRFFEFVEDLDVDVPLVCMTYYNLIYQYGESEASASDTASGDSAERSSADRSSGQSPREEAASKEDGPRPFVEKAAEVGLTGFVVPDLPAEEAGPLRDACDEFGLDLVFIVAPTTTGERLERMREQVSGYIYVQARLGTTGARDDVSDQTDESLARIEDWDVPKAVGFGIKQGDHAERIVAAGADGIIVGSALVDIIAEHHGSGTESGNEADDTVEAVADRLESKARELSEGARRGAQQGAEAGGN